MREMKDSGIEWIGDVPASWNVVPIRATFEEVTQRNTDGTIRNALKFTYGRIVEKGNFDADEDNYVADTIRNYTVVTPGTIMLNGLNLNFDFISQRVGLVKDTGVITSAYTAFRPKNGSVMPEYATYLFKSYDNCKAFHNMGGGVRKILNFSELKRQYVVYPSLDEQKRIADFLDGKCAEIDGLVADIQSQIDTLEQYKRSVIFETLSNGITGEPLVVTESSVWKKIPCSWKLTDIKYLFEIVKRIAGQEGFDVLSVTQKGLRVKNIHSNEGQLAENYSHYQFVYPTDYVMNHMDLLTGWVDCSTQFGVTSPDYRVFRLIDKENNDLTYWKYVMQCCYLCRIFYSLGQGVSNLGRWRLQTSTFMNFKVPVPPMSEQKLIANFLDSKVYEIDSIIDQKKEQLTVLENYKKSLIYEYVTGKKEVPAQ